eukprot:1158420-Pelagomonas_calceolata.AAC.3
MQVKGLHEHYGMHALKQGNACLQANRPAVPLFPQEGRARCNLGACQERGMHQHVWNQIICARKWMHAWGTPR